MASTADPEGALSERLRNDTRADHEATGGSPMLASLTAGRLPREAYTDLTAQHFFIYEALESAAAAMADDPVAGVFAFPELHRLSSLVADLEFLCGPGWADGITALPATAAYCARLRAVAFDQPSAFVAHHYTRCLGDLAGGHDIGRAVAQVYGLRSTGRRFYLFDGVDPTGLQARYRELLDATSWQAAEQERFLDEVSQAYRLNVAVLAGLWERWS